jgi:hypothetical protein
MMHMHRGIPCLFALAAACVAVPAHARDTQFHFGVDPALASTEAKDRFDDSVQFYFGDRPYPQPVQSFGIHESGRRLLAPTQSDEVGCQLAFVEALAALRDAAKEAGANAVVDIKSISNNREFRSASEFECHSGYIVSEVTLEGRLVKLPAPGVTTVKP